MGLIERLKEGIVIGDGGFVMTMEKRGYVVAGSWTPEACVLHPHAVRQLHREFMRAGADVLQTFTFGSSDDRLQSIATQRNDDELKKLTTGIINKAAVNIARSVAKEGDVLVAGSVSPALSVKDGKERCQHEFRKQMAVYKEKGSEVDFVIAEFFSRIEEAEWALEVMSEIGIPMACTMRIPPSGDFEGVSVKECAVRMAKAGACLVGVNCNFDPDISLRVIALMKEGLHEAGLRTYLMVQPLGYHTQDEGMDAERRGYVALPEWPLGMETRALTRMDAHRFARKAYELGVRYIGGCCGFEPHLIKAISDELSVERGRRAPGATGLTTWENLKLSAHKSQQNRANREYWDKVEPAAGRHLKDYAQLLPEEEDRE